MCSHSTRISRFTFLFPFSIHTLPFKMILNQTESKEEEKNTEGKEHLRWNRNGVSIHATNQFKVIFSNGFFLTSNSLNLALFLSPFLIYRKYCVFFPSSSSFVCFDSFFLFNIILVMYHKMYKYNIWIVTFVLFGVSFVVVVVELSHFDFRCALIHYARICCFGYLGALLSDHALKSFICRQSSFFFVVSFLFLFIINLIF